MYNDKQLIVLMAGKGTRLYPLTLTTPKCLLSIKQKPAIYNMIVPLINKGLRDITFVVNNENKSILENFMSNSFSNLDINFNYVIQKDFKGPGEALRLTKKYINKKVILLLGDTIVSYPSDYSNSFIAVQKVKKDDKQKYCIVESDNDKLITKLVNKPVEVIDSNLAAIGLYYFNNYELLKEVLSKKITKETGEIELSDYFLRYMEKETMHVKEVYDWQDIGSLENYRNSINNSFNCRNFNSLYLDELTVLHKKSTYEKIKSEINWFKEINNTDYDKLTPKFYHNNIFENEYAIEYYDYLTLNEYFTFYPLYSFNKEYIFENLFKKLNSIYLKNKIYSLSFKDFMNEMLISKTKRRLNDWDRKDLIESETIIINNKKYFGVNKLLKKLQTRIDKICEDSINYISIIHGDPAFSNILFSPRSMIYKLIDPRGNFCIDTMYGDYRYDIAKLRHCYHGRYDEIINDLFNVTNNKNKIELDFYKQNDYETYDKILKKNKININDIEIIEGLFFLSMIPLHSESKEHQLAFFAQGIKMLNNQLEEGFYDVD
ncbi:MAG: hypothetical protein IKL65_01000 [Bacilli bacterium]|nr:hypothetical protein [Bacilli bacterium]